MSQRYAWIQGHQGQHSVEKMAQMLEVTPSRYYAWRKVPQSPRERENEQLQEEMEQIWQASHQRYGSPRMTQALRQKGFEVGHNRVARLMRDSGMRAKRKHRWKATTQSKHKLPVAENLLARGFKADKPNQKWVADITYIPTVEGWLYLAVVLDLHSRKIVGWSMMEMKTALVLDALNMAVVNRRPAPGLIFHSDRGVQYASEAFRQKLSELGFQQSMSRKGNCWYNVCFESFFSSMKQEGCGIIFKSRREARIHLFEYIECFYSRQRLHSTLGYFSPDDFERRSA